MKKLFYDIEVYPNYWLVVLQDEQDKFYTVSSDDEDFKVLRELNRIKDRVLFVGYNNTHYDALILEILLDFSNKSHFDSKENKNDISLLVKNVYQASKMIVEDNDKFKVLPKYVGYKDWTTYQLDLFQLDPQKLSLKEFGVRIHHEKLETLPIPPHQELDFLDKPTIIEYCKNDVIITRKLHDTVVSPKVELKHDLIESFNLDPYFFSRSNRDITEEILCDKSMKPFKKEFSYVFPYDFTFKIDEFQFLKNTFENIDFNSDEKFSTQIKLGDLVISYALGGIHGVVKNYQGENLIDIDVASYYPNILRNLKALPQTVADPEKFYKMIDERVEMKKTDPKKANAYKEVINTVYGAMNYTYGNKLGMLYDYEGLNKITITGQLLLTKLMEDLYLAGYSIVYANTDGLMIEDNGSKDYIDIIRAWEDEFNLVLEEEHIAKAIIKDVNNYILIKDNGKLKIKGHYNDKLGSKWGAFANISRIAVMEYLTKGTPIEQTIREDKDIKNFVLYDKFSRQFYPTQIKWDTARVDNFDKVVRYYLSSKNKNQIEAKNNNTGSWIRKTLGMNVQSIPVLPDTLPDDIDYERYIDIAYDKLEQLTGEEMLSNPYIEGLVKELQLHL